MLDGLFLAGLGLLVVVVVTVVVVADVVELGDKVVLILHKCLLAVAGFSVVVALVLDDDWLLSTLAWSTFGGNRELSVPLYLLISSFV